MLCHLLDTNGEVDVALAEISKIKSRKLAAVEDLRVCLKILQSFDVCPG